MKAHLIISKKQSIRQQLLEELKEILQSGCSKHLDKIAFFNDYSDDYTFEMLYELEAPIQLLSEFPADLVTALKPNGSFRIVITDKNELQSNFNGGYSDYRAITLHEYNFEITLPHVVKYLYFLISTHLVKHTDWPNDTKATLIDYYKRKASTHFQHYVNNFKTRAVEING